MPVRPYCRPLLTPVAQVLDNDPALHFALLRLQLVELIRTCTAQPGGDITPALTFASAELAPRAPLKPEFLEELEQAMALIVFPRDRLEPRLAALLQPDLRRQVADRVNQAVLGCENEHRELSNRNLNRLRLWSDRNGRDEKLPALSGIDMALGESDRAGNGDVMASS